MPNTSKREFTISAGTENVVIQGLQFEAGTEDGTVPVGGLDDGTGGGTFIGIGTVGSANAVQQVTIQNNRFGVMRYGRNQQGGTYGTDINIRSSADDLTIRENFMDASPTNVIYMRGHSSVPPIYRRFIFQDNIVAHSQGEHSFGSALQPLLQTYSSYGHFEDFVVEGNTFHDVNSTINVDMGGYGLNISNNTVKSDNLDGVISAIAPGTPPDDKEIVGFVVSSNACYGDDEPSHEDKVPETSCQLNVGGRNGVVIGNSLRSISEVGNLNVKYSDNVLVASNTVEMADNDGNCYGLFNSSDVRFVNNICVDGTTAFSVSEAFGYDNEQLEFVGNVLRTSSSASAPTYFLYFGSGASDVVVRSNEVRGKNPTGAFVYGGASSMNQAGNIRAIEERGFRIGDGEITWEAAQSHLKVDKPWGWKDEGSEVEILEAGSGMLHKWLPSSQTYQVYASGGFDFVTSVGSADDITIGDANDNDQTTVRGDLLLAGGVLKLNAQSSAPVTCSSSHKGAMYFDTDINDACLCNGSRWVPVLGAGICG